MMIWYKNSILASIFSLAGCSLALAAIYELTKAQNSELSIPEAIGAIAVGFLLAFIGNRISAHKTKKKRAQPTAASASAGADFAQSRQTAAYTFQQAGAFSAEESVKIGEPVKASIVVAGILLMLVLLFNYLIDRRIPYELTHSVPDFLEYLMYLLLAVAAFHTRATQKISIAYLVGFLGLCVPAVETACYYFNNGTAGVITNYTMNGVLYAMQAAAFLLMALFTFSAMETNKTGGKGATRTLWWLPALLLLLSYAMKLIDGNNSMVHILQRSGWIGLENVFKHPVYLTVLIMFCTFLAVILMGICFRRFCQKPEIVFHPSAAYAQAAPQYEAPVSPVQPQPQPQTVPGTSAEPAAASANQQEAEKMRAAYKDLLEMGIMTMEEYEQKIKELH